MAGWHSLSGYLYFRPGGTLGKLKVRKRLWYMFEDSSCHLQYYKSKEDAMKSKEPQGFININGAAITLSLNDHNQFIILSNNKEYILTADNHESMMIWLMGLQAKRDAHAMNAQKVQRVEEGPKSPLEAEDAAAITPHKKRTQMFRRSISAREFNFQSDPIQSERLIPPTADAFRRGSLKVKSEYSRNFRMSRKFTESVDAALDSYCDGDPLNASWDFDKAMSGSRSMEGVVNLMHSFNGAIHPNTSLEQIAEPAVDEDMEPNHKQRFPSSSSTDNGSSTSEVFGTEEQDAMARLVAMETSTQAVPPPGGSNGDKPSAISKPIIRNQSDLTEIKIAQFYRERVRSLSGHSASSDSALERSSESEMATKMSELEQELVDVKCEFAKIKNREMCYKTILEKRDALIIELDEKVEQLTELQRDRDKKSLDKRLREQIRVLQNQNRFLNEEVKKLARLLQQERERFQDQDKRHHYLEGEIDRWKRDYVYLLQSSITVPTGDLSDGMAVSLYGGNRHRSRIQQLLEEARESNPCLPTMEKLAGSEVHIDNYGFKHSHETEGILLHYICQQLHLWYTTQLPQFVENSRRWKDILMRSQMTIVRTKELKVLCRNGIPPHFRSEMWRQLVYHQVKDIKDEKGPHYFSNLVNSAHESEFAGRYRKQISLDLLRTMPGNVNFNTPNAQGITKLQEVLSAFCIHNPNTGYCQGMNFITAMALLFMDAEDAFWTLVAITERFFSPNYFDQHLSGAQADQDVMKDLMSEKLPYLYSYISNLDIELSTVTLNWFLAIFFDAVPFETLIRIWDCFLLEGPKVLFRFALAILKMHQPSILKKGDTISIMRHLKSCAGLTYDVEGLIREAFEGLKPFPRRQDIAAKQALFLKSLKEKLKKQEMQRRAYDEKEQKLRELDLLDPSNTMMFECATVAEEGYVWVCYGEQSQSKICLVSCDEGLVYDMGMEVESRIKCICSVEESVILVGNLASQLIAYSVKTREEVWNVRLHDTVLSLCCYLEEDFNIIFAALADGTVAVLENVCEEEPRDDPFYIPIGRCPVTALTLVDQHLWCACGNNVHVLHAETLDTLDKFTTSSNPFDHILAMAYSEMGMWISVKGSSIIELWDPINLTLKMLYDAKDNKHPTMKREDDGCLNMSRVTTVLPLGDAVWIGTGDGNLIMFDVISTKGPSNSNTSSALDSPLLSHRSYGDDGDKLDRKARDLYHQQSWEEKHLRKKKSSTGKDSHRPRSRPVSRSDSRSSVTKDSENQHSIELAMEVDSTEGSSVTSPDSPKKPYRGGSAGSGGHERSSAISKGQEKYPESPRRKRMFSPSRSPRRYKRSDSSESSKGAEDKTKSELDEAMAARKQQLDENANSKNANCDKTCDEKSVNEAGKEANNCDDISLESLDIDTFLPGLEKKEGVSVLVRKDNNNPSIEICDVDNTNKTTEEPIVSSNYNENLQNLENTDVKNSSVLPESGYGDTSTSLTDTSSATSKVSSRECSEKEAESDDTMTSSQVEDDDTKVTVTVEALNISKPLKPTELKSKELSPRSRYDRMEHANESILAQVLKHVQDKQQGAVMAVEETTEGVAVEKEPFLQLLSPINEGAESSVSEVEESQEAKTQIGGQGSNHGQLPNDAIIAVNKRLLTPDFTLSLDGTTVSATPKLSPISEGGETTSAMTSPCTHSNPEAPSHSPPTSQAQPSKKASEPMNERMTELMANYQSPETDNCSPVLPDPPSNTPDMPKRHLEEYLQNGGTGWSSMEETKEGATGTNDLLNVPKHESKNSKRSGQGRHSRSHSNVSNCSVPTEHPFFCEMSLQAKIKISDKPIRCLIFTRSNEEPVIISCAGCYGDDEAVLKWRKEYDEKLWTNEPVFEVCLETKVPKTPMYMRQLSNSSGNQSMESLKNFFTSPRKLSLTGASGKSTNSVADNSSQV